MIVPSGESNLMAVTAGNGTSGSLPDLPGSLALVAIDVDTLPDLTDITLATGWTG